MKPDRLPSPRSLIELVEKLGANPPELELFVLKAHLIVERQMYWLLAHRLDIEERHLPPLQFFSLAKLALGGEPYKAALLKVLALNDLRNEFGHELSGQGLNAKAQLLCERTGIFWPLTDPLHDEAAILLFREASARLAALSVSGDVWAAIVELSLERHIYPDEVAEQSARGELDKYRLRVAARSEDQNAKRSLWNQVTAI